MIEDETPPRDMASLLARIAAARAALEGVLDGLTEARLTAPGGPGGWSIKDHLAHLARWEYSLAALLTGQPRHAAMDVDEATYQAGADAINAILSARDRARPLAAVRADFDAAHGQVLAALARLGDADLTRTYSSYQPDEPGEDSGEPIVNWIAGNTYEHYGEHQQAIEALAR